MPSREDRSGLLIATSLGPDQRTGAANGTGVDLVGFEAATVEILTDTFGGTTPTATAKVQESTDNSTFTDVADSDLIGVTGNTAGFALAASSVKTIAYIGQKRFIRVRLDTVGGTSPVIRVSASVIRSRPHKKPTL